MKKIISPLIIFFVFLIDRLSKEWVIRNVSLGESWDVLPFFHLTYVENTGIAFGMGQNQNLLFIGTSILLIILLLIFQKHWKMGGNLLFQIGLSFVIGGALGNLYDRIIHGSVIDFLDFFAGPYHWPAFNAADSFICIGTFFLIFAQYKHSKS